MNWLHYHCDIINNIIIYKYNFFFCHSNRPLEFVISYVITLTALELICDSHQHAHQGANLPAASVDWQDGDRIHNRQGSRLHIHGASYILCCKQQRSVCCESFPTEIKIRQQCLVHVSYLLLWNYVVTVAENIRTCGNRGFMSTCVLRSALW